MEIVELKNSGSEMKISFAGLTSELDKAKKDILKSKVCHCKLSKLKKIKEKKHI